jgi:hypothetical protein
MTTLLDHRTTLAYLGYLGCAAEPRTAALHVTRPRRADRRKGKSTRSVFLCYVCGAAGSGKTALLRAFAERTYREPYEPTSKVLSVVNAVDLDGEEKYLVVSARGRGGNVGRMLMGASAARVWEQIRGRDLAQLQEDGFGGCDRVRVRFERHQLVFVHLQLEGTSRHRVPSLRT